MPLMFFDWTIFILLPAIVLAMWAQNRVSTNLNKYAQVNTKRGLSGAVIASQVLADHGLRDVKVERLPDHKPWGDHYDPKCRTIRLSPHVYDGHSISAAAVAVHEVGHAIQHSERYSPLAVRTGFFPVVKISSGAAVPLIFIGFILGMLGFVAPQWSMLIIDIGIIFFAVTVVFHLITLPVEFNASRRAMELLEAGRYIDGDNEVAMTRKVLNAAAMTYVAAAAVAIAQLLRFILMANSRR
ncbi:MAG: zinc metallopeptidase [Defluviitaleaceae bacterium]|nr:zinc metallopeptidase [Defluviitaleaceae bacterium]